MLIFVSMSKQSLLKAVAMAGGQAQLAKGVREQMPGSKVGQVHVWGWLNSVKMEVPPADVVIPMAASLDWRISPHELRPDLYPNPTDALPADPADYAGPDRRHDAEPGHVMARRRADNHKEAA
jgi:hypothetical protein